MLTQLRFQNFKSWRETGEMRIAPLTGFFGTNSSGKTSILQFLLMLKQTAESNDRTQVLNFGNEHTYVDLGTAKNLLHKQQIPSRLEFSLAWDRGDRLPYLSLPIEYVQVGENHFTSAFALVSQMQFSAAVEFDDEYIAAAQMIYSYPAKSGEPAQICLLKQGSDYSLVGTGMASVLPEIVGHDVTIGSPWKVYGFSREVFGGSPWRNLDSSFEHCFADIYYLGPVRDYPKRFYSWSGETPHDVGRYGENTIAALLSARKQDPEIEAKIAHWLKFMGLIKDFKLDLIAPEQRLYQASVRIAPGGTYVPLTDVGFGMSQILPVLVLCYYVPQGSTIIFEQPEIHLHPSAQQKLADVFIDVIKTRDLQIILESHSEHLLHRLQRRMAENGLNPSGFNAEDAALYFCEMGDDGASQISQLEVDPFGNITNWPTDFFGNEMEDLVAMTEAAVQREAAANQTATEAIECTS
ncbi:MAG: hypothetical protein RLZZ511_1671 [Cyanobacteriota bacterium]|jgi:predicted ATPase